MRPILALPIGLTGLLTVLVFGAMGLGAAFPGDEIAFQVRGDCCFEIHVLDLRTNIQRIFDDSLLDTYAPSWSPDGTHLAFFTAARNELSVNLCVAEADGANIQCTSVETNRLNTPAWSPEGTRIAFYDVEGTYTLDVNAFDQPPVPLEVAQGSILNAAWSPDGSQIAYVVYRGVPAIFILNLDTNESRRLAVGGNLVWSPDGTQLAYVSALSVLTIPVEGGEPTYITDGNNPAWSPDGEWLVFSRGDPRRVADLVMRHLDSGHEIKLVSNGRLNLAPSWRPR